LPLGLATGAREAATDVVPSTFALNLATPATSLASSALTMEAYESINSWFDSYAHSRITKLTFPDREPATFGPWTARKDFATADAAADGSLTEWADDYFITHDWSPIGSQILTMMPGDVVFVNDLAFVVEEAFEYPKASYLNEVRAVCGEDTIILQTCVPAQDRNRIVFGHAI